MCCGNISRPCLEYHSGLEHWQPGILKWLLQLHRSWLICIHLWEHAYLDTSIYHHGHSRFKQVVHFLVLTLLSVGQVFCFSQSERVRPPSIWFGVGWQWSLSSIKCPCPGLTAYHIASYSSACLVYWNLTLKLDDVDFQMVAPPGLTLPLLAFQSFLSLSYDRSTAFSKVSSHTGCNLELTLSF
jgi:hypothetical protein